jgi:hypothetical protein
MFDDATKLWPQLLRDTRSGRVVGLAIWESKEAFEAAMPEVFRSYDDPDPEGAWEERPTEIMHLSAVR